MPRFRLQLRGYFRLNFCPSQKKEIVYLNPSVPPSIILSKNTHSKGMENKNGLKWISAVLAVLLLVSIFALSRLFTGRENGTAVQANARARSITRKTRFKAARLARVSVLYLDKPE